MKTNQLPTLYQGFGLQSGKPQDPSKAQGVIGSSFPREESSRGFISNKSQPKLGYDMEGIWRTQNHLLRQLDIEIRNTLRIIDNTTTVFHHTYRL